MVCSKQTISSRATMKQLLLLFLLALGFATECRYACDDPIGRSECTPRCLDPVCVYDPPCGDKEPNAQIRCAEGVDVLPTEMCPMCETVVSDIPDECLGNVLCEAPQCGWECHINPLTSPPHPRCELQCEQPACEFSSSSRISMLWSW